MHYLCTTLINPDRDRKIQGRLACGVVTGLVRCRKQDSNPVASNWRRFEVVTEMDRENERLWTRDMGLEQKPLSSSKAASSRVNKKSRKVDR